MNYRIVKTETFKVFGLEGIVSTAGDARYFPHVRAIWDEFNNGKPDSKYDKLCMDAGKVKPPFYESVFVQDMCKVHGLDGNGHVEGIQNGVR